MKTYVIAEVTVTDDSWLPGYAARVHDIVHRHGGRYLARSSNISTLEGKPGDVTLIALLEFPSKQAAQDMLDDPEYRPHGEARRAGSHSVLRAIDATDAAGTIPYLAKAG